MNLNFPHHKQDDMQNVDTHAGIMTAAIIALADNAKNVPELARLSSALYQFMLGSEAEKKMQRSLYSLDEYMSLRQDQCEGKAINETYLHQLREELLGDQRS